jgi:hypothetical protein
VANGVSIHLAVPKFVVSALAQHKLCSLQRHEAYLHGEVDEYRCNTCCVRCLDRKM